MGCQGRLFRVSSISDNVTPVSPQGKEAFAAQPEGSKRSEVFQGVFIEGLWYPLIVGVRCDLCLLKGGAAERSVRGEQVDL